VDRYQLAIGERSHLAKNMLAANIEIAGKSKWPNGGVIKVVSSSVQISPRLKRYKNFFRAYQKFPEIFMFCPNFVLIFARP
jgi:hypothetical protein